MRVRQIQLILVIIAVAATSCSRKRAPILDKDKDKGKKNNSLNIEPVHAEGSVSQFCAGDTLLTDAQKAAESEIYQACLAEKYTETSCRVFVCKQPGDADPRVKVEAEPEPEPEPEPDPTPVPAPVPAQVVGSCAEGAAKQTTFDYTLITKLRAGPQRSATEHFEFKQNAVPVSKCHVNSAEPTFKVWLCVTVKSPTSGAMTMGWATAGSDYQTCEQIP